MSNAGRRGRQAVLPHNAPASGPARPWAALLHRLPFLAALVALCAGSAVNGAETNDLSRPGAAGQPTRVQVGLYLADLSEVSAAEETFVADVLLRAEWDDPRLARPAAAIREADLQEIWNPRLQLVAGRGVTVMLPQRVTIDPTGHVMYRQRWFGRFGTRLDLRDFPRDRQHFRLQVGTLGYTRADVDLVGSSWDVKPKDPSAFSVADWEVGPGTLGAADIEVAPGQSPFAGIELTWDGRRYVGYYLVQVLLPLLSIVLMGWIALWIDPTVVTSRVSVVMTTMLTLIAYRFSLGKSIPPHRITTAPEMKPKALPDPA